MARCGVADSLKRIPRADSLVAQRLGRARKSLKYSFKSRLNPVNDDESHARARDESVFP